uniref:SFRICE_029447 n=1 Tax=Spodoptera frugiperda TaxID=7108 RepID=A0A2H1VH92_SPOFR
MDVPGTYLVPMNPRRHIPNEVTGDPITPFPNCLNPDSLTNLKFLTPNNVFVTPRVFQLCAHRVQEVKDLDHVVEPDPADDDALQRRVLVDDLLAPEAVVARQKDQIKNILKRRACMKRLITVEEARDKSLFHAVEVAGKSQ